ncbi:hypothetical protein O9993_05550 [Vibrio lentus]|nr:hypothetical protein [Vibrio lentus]
MTHRVIEVAAWSERVAAVIVERQAAFGHIINQLVAYRTVHIRGRWHRCRSVPGVFGRFSRVFATGVVAARHGNGDGLRLAHACVVVVAVCEGQCVSFDPTGHRSRCLSERVAAVIVERSAASVTSSTNGSYRTVHDRGRWHVAVQYLLSAVSVASATGRVVAALVTVMVMVFRSLTPVSLSVACM